jgi:hypothetical protein
VILSTGRFVVIRDKFCQQDGHLVLIAHYWESEADCAAGKPPVASHDHMFINGNAEAHEPIHPNDDSVGPMIAGVLNTAVCSVHRVRTDHVRGEDKSGWLAHPHVQALEVTP